MATANELPLPVVSGNRNGLWTELIVVFLFLPLLIYAGALPNWPIPLLLIVAGYAFWILRRDGAFESVRLVRFRSVWSGLGRVLLRDALLMAIIGVGVWRFAPRLLFSMVERNPVLWAAILVLYPLLSVYPQELLFRGFFFHRYEPLFGSGSAMIIASAAAFSFVHIIFGNWLAVALTFIGGVLFSLTYRKSGSLNPVCLEHALFGNFLFTIGLGQFFYHAYRL
jgi:membrane protease YdiL (CAAX protease family)